MSTNDVQRLREETGAGVMECKRALDEAKNDFARAKQIVAERGFAKAAKREGRATGAGLVKSYVHNGRVGVLLDVRAETDFVVRSEPFQELAQELVMQIAAMAPEDVPALLAAPYIKDESKTVEALVKGVIAKVGENITITRFIRYEL